MATPVGPGERKFRIITLPGGGLNAFRMKVVPETDATELPATAADAPIPDPPPPPPPPATPPAGPREIGIPEKR